MQIKKFNRDNFRPVVTAFFLKNTSKKSAFCRQTENVKDLKLGQYPRKLIKEFGRRNLNGK